MEWILASQSPRRKQLLKEIIEQFEIIPAKGEEILPQNATVDEKVLALATQKAEEVASLPSSQGKWVLGADTIVVLKKQILGKPKDEQDAKRMLAALSGKTHQVLTGVCMMKKQDGQTTSLLAVGKTKVIFHRLSKTQIENYVASGSPMDKAGAYGIQDGGLVKKIKGSFSNVVGLPIELCKAMIDTIKQQD